MNNQKINIAENNAIKNSPLSINPGNYILSAFLIICSALLGSQVRANELNTTHTSSSYEALSQKISDDMRLNFIEKNDTSVISDQIIGKATEQTRDEIQQITKANLLTQPGSRSYAQEFTIYNAFAILLDDFDRDGYHQTFSVIFDADIYSYDGNDIGEVYARLYLSEDGGPWFHYYTTDNFIIHSDSDQDEYEVITNFVEGYPPGHYDILIDLYQVGYPGIVATYSSDDNQALYALPLESAEHDQVYVDTVYIHHSGSLSALSLIILLLLLASRLAQLNFWTRLIPIRKIS